jgi:hypothetical protein
MFNFISVGRHDSATSSTASSSLTNTELALKFYKELCDTMSRDMLDMQAKNTQLLAKVGHLETYIRDSDNKHASNINNLKSQHTCHVTSLETEYQRQLTHSEKETQRFWGEACWTRGENGKLHNRNEALKRNSRLIYAEYLKKQEENAAAISSLEAEHQAKVNELHAALALQQSSHEAATETLQSTHQAEIAELSATHQSHVSRVQEAHDAELEAVE